MAFQGNFSRGTQRVVLSRQHMQLARLGSQSQPAIWFIFLLTELLLSYLSKKLLRTLILILPFHSQGVSR